MRIDNTFMAHLRSGGSVLPFLVTLSMLTDRAGCYNVRDEKTHCTQAYLYRQFLRNCHLLRA